MLGVRIRKEIREISKILPFMGAGAGTCVVPLALLAVFALVADLPSFGLLVNIRPEFPITLASKQS